MGVSVCEGVVTGEINELSVSSPLPYSRTTFMISLLGTCTRNRHALSIAQSLDQSPSLVSKAHKGAIFGGQYFP